MTQRIRITDVSPRDGLQAEKAIVATVDKARLVELVQRTGVDEVEVSSFVSPRWVPQLGDAADLFDLIAQGKPDGVCYSALVPNGKGLETVLAVNHAAR
ncbi:MAG TPA: hydroxymethylglutaryl-CoA lyase, partial [Phycisphaerales bacterium]|nr:hydroxymethylglutaryl-CoA lyase [Phycisphaerales bacterium]